MAEGVFVADLFESKQKRTQALRKKLTNTEVLRSYYQARVANLYRGAPILRNKLKLHSKLEESLAEPNEVPLETLIAGVSNAVKLSFAESSLLENSFQAIEAGVKEVIITKADAIAPGQGTCVK